MTDDTLRLACELALVARRRADKRRRRARPSASPDDTPVRRSPMQRRGDFHEDAALRLLLAQGLVLLARNLWTRAGEIDLAMRDGDTLVFVEVRARGRTRYGGAAASIGRDKQARLARAAAQWLPELARRHWHGTPPAARFDAVVFDDGQPQWLRGAFLLA
ncbi:YraN family protein [Achromobacter sp. UMC46]|uniref:YraN family protein n=1 Tax=Achromobacter sp. UMC46 TaxID=1862319 RepID=UPI0016035887|nr:YraN family protein [Achromobacter sp. UMC46]MBB1592603.1 YraN family protein [Achromobacter sp. UMC46]MBB1598327.1 YraN family protein [Achromobacter sp. UMC46]